MSPLVGGRAVKGPADACSRGWPAGRRPPRSRAATRVWSTPRDRRVRRAHRAARGCSLRRHGDADARRRRRRRLAARCSTRRAHPREGRVLGGTGSFGVRIAPARRARRGRRRVGSRDAERAQRSSARSSAGAQPARRTRTRSRGVDLAVLAVKAEGALETAGAIADALGARRCSRSRARFGSAAEGVLSRPRRALARRARSGSRARGQSPPVCIRSPPQPRPRPAARGRARLRRRRAAKQLALELAASSSRASARAGPLASARTLEGLTAVIVNLNRRYKAHAGIAVTGPRTVISILPVQGLPEIRAGDDLAALIASASTSSDADVVVDRAEGGLKSGGSCRSHRRRRIRQGARARGRRRDLRQLEVDPARVEASDPRRGQRS